MTCTSISAPMAHAFDPAQWLDKFAAVSGGYTLTDHALHLFVTLTGTTIDQQRQGRRMLEGLSDNQRRLVYTYIAGEDLPPVRRATIVSRPAVALSKRSLRLVSRINAVCRQHGIHWSTFGRRAMRDPRFMHDLFMGRQPKPATMRRLNAFIANMGGV